MIVRDKTNSFALLFAWRGTILPKVFPALMVGVLISTLLVYLATQHYVTAPAVPVIGFTVFGVILSIFLSFRNTACYDRWWEGRKLWGSLVNNSRNLALKMNSLLPHDDEKNRSFFKKIIPLFAVELKNHLQNEKTRLALDAQPHHEITGFDTSKHIPNQVVAVLLNKIHLLKRDRVITEFELLYINNELQSFMDICGACERIKNTPIPYSYSAFIKKFIFLYIITLPLGFALTLGYFTIPATLFISYVLASLELIAEEIEDPFGNDDNDLPMERIAANISKNVHDILA